MKKALRFLMLFPLFSFAAPVKYMVAANESESVGDEGIVEVEYLESTGIQWIDTGIIGKDGITASTVVTVMGKSRNSCILGAWSSTTTRCWPCYMFMNEWYLGYGNYGGSSSTSVALGETVEVSTDTNGKYAELYLDGSLLKSGRFTSGFDSGLPIFMFAMNTSSGRDYMAAARVHSCRIWLWGELVRDFIPVRIGREGYMLDLVSGELFGNDGDGAFLIGPDRR